MPVHGLKHSEILFVHVGTKEPTELERMRVGVDLARAPCASAWHKAFRKLFVHAGTKEPTELERMRIGVDLARALCTTA